MTRGRTKLAKFLLRMMRDGLASEVCVNLRLSGPEAGALADLVDSLDALQWCMSGAQGVIDDDERERYRREAEAAVWYAAGRLAAWDDQT